MARLMVTTKPSPSKPPDLEILWLATPTCTVSESPIRARTGRVGGRSSSSSATSASGSEATTLAGIVSPPRNSAVISSAVCTTWAAVMILPSAETRNPEPTSETRPLTSFHRARMMTTEGFTRRNT